MAYKISNFDIIDDTRRIINAATIGIGTTIPTTGSTKLSVIGDSFIAGIQTAVRFVSNVAQGTAPIAVGSSTRVDTLNVQYLDGNDSAFYRNASNLNAGTVPGARVTESQGLVVTGNLNVSGNVTIGGTSTITIGETLRIRDRDITLGITTDANGNDISTDITANHGGIAIASTEGSPIINIPIQAGINTDPSTYKQFMWIRQGNYSGMGTDAWVSNYAISIGNTASVQNGSRLTVGAGFTVFDTYLDATDIRARNVNISGIITSGTHNLTTGNSYQINGTSVLNATTLGSGVVNSSLTSVGTLTNLNVGNVNSTGIITATSFVGNGAQLTGINAAQVGAISGVTVRDEGSVVGTAGNVTSINFVGSNIVATAAGAGATITISDNLVGSSLNITGLSTLTTLVGTNINYTGVGTITTLNSTTSSVTNRTGTNLNITGVGTITNITNTNINSSGIHTAAQYNIGATAVLATVSSQIRLSGIATIDATTKATLERELAFAPNDLTDLNVSGISSLRSTTIIGSGTSTGTANQVFQVAGISSGAYIGGSLGIGVTNPSTTLDVNGSVRLRTSITDNNGATGSPNQILTAGPSGAGVTWATLNASSVGALSAVTVTNDTSTATPLFPIFTSSTGTSITGVNVDTSGLTFIPSGVGSLGIGTTSPTTTLDVNGSVRLRTSITDNNNATGSANQVLTAGPTGAGVTWATLNAASVGAISGINVSQDDAGIRYPLLAAGANATTTVQYVDATALAYNTATNCLGIGSLTPTSRLDIIGDVRVSGIITATDFNSSSDRNLKDNIQVIPDSIEKVLQLNGVSFSWKASGESSMGVIAQDVEKVLPELVSDTNPKSVNYNGLIGLLIECVKEQQKQIDELKQITAKKTTRKPKNI